MTQLRTQNAAGERRRHFRALVHLPVWLGRPGASAETVEKMQVLSVGGAFIATPRQPCVVGDLVNLRFELPDGEGDLTCTAVVRYMQVGHGLGVEFVDVASDAQTRLRRFIQTEIDDYLRYRR